MPEKTKHTPGPWIRHPDYPKVIVAEADPTTSLLSLRFDRGDDEDPVAQFANEANAQLAATAPDMRDALDLVCSLFAGPKDPTPADVQRAYKAARSALLKAEGRS